jgi:hypothetical protein
LKGSKKFFKSHCQDLILGPSILSQKPGEVGEGSRKKREGRGLHPGRSVPFFYQLDETKNERRKDFKRGA